jgi:hypothetical protein
MSTCGSIASGRRKYDHAEARLSLEYSERIMDMVRHELVENPDVANAALFEKAQHLDPAAMDGVDRRQFNARYPLQVKRREMVRPPKPKSDGAAARRRRKKASADGAGAAAGAAAPAAASPVAPPLSVLRTLARDGVRDVLLRFAQDMANADSRGALVSVVASADQYVDQILRLGDFPE